MHDKPRILKLSRFTLEIKAQVEQITQVSWDDPIIHERQSQVQMLEFARNHSARKMR